MHTTPSDEPRRLGPRALRAFERRFGLKTSSGARAPEGHPSDPNHSPEAHEAFIYSAPETHRHTETELRERLRAIGVPSETPLTAGDAVTPSFAMVPVVAILSLAHARIPANEERARDLIAEAADDLMALFEIANVLETVERLAEDFPPAALTQRGRVKMLLLLIELRRAAHEDETYAAEPTDGSNPTAKLHGVTDEATKRCPECGGEVQLHPQSDDVGLCSECGFDVYAAERDQEEDDR